MEYKGLIAKFIVQLYLRSSRNLRVASDHNYFRSFIYNIGML
jgi:hypothetical protein